MADPWRVRMARIAQLFEAAGGGTPRSVPTRRGARQFIFPNGAVVRFDIEFGQYGRAQGPHINLERFPGSPSSNLHIGLQP